MRRSDVVLALAILVATAACVRLGFWQLDRYRLKQKLNAERAATLSAAPIPWDGSTTSPDVLGRRLAVSGRYDSTVHVLLAYREREGTTGVEVVTPLILNSSARVLVNRGWLPSEDGVSARPQDFVEPGVLEVVGVAESLAHGRFGVHEVERDSVRVLSTRALDADTLTARLGPLAPFVLRQLPGAGVPEHPRRSAPLPLPTGMHLGYAIQWFVIAAVLLAGGGAMLRLKSGRGHP